jgi:VIT1/CCC1 family predicted Fe2+/Mn2+ transporter
MSARMADEVHHHPHALLGDFILGLNDGLVTTLVFALGVAGASSKNNTVVVAGLAEMLAGGVSMFLGGFLSGQSEKEAAEHQIAVERHEIEHEPEEEREELRRIYAEKGFSGAQLATIVDHLTSDKERWLNSLIRDELLLRPGELINPWKVASALGASFVAGAFLPIAPFLLHLSFAPAAATIVSISALFVTGAARSRFSRRSWLRSGLQMVAVGLVGAGAGVLIGRLLANHL